MFVDFLSSKLMLGWHDITLLRKCLVIFLVTGVMTIHNNSGLSPLSPLSLCWCSTSIFGASTLFTNDSPRTNLVPVDAGRRSHLQISLPHLILNAIPAREIHHNPSIHELFALFANDSPTIHEAIKTSSHITTFPRSAGTSRHSGQQNPKENLTQR